MKILKKVAIAAICSSFFTQAPAYAQEYFARHKLEVVSGPQGPAAAWETGAWSSWSNSCSNAAVRTRTVLCKKGPEMVPDTNCPVFDRPPTNEVQTITTGCSYDWIEQQGTWSQACGAGSTRVTSSVCRRSDNTVADDSECTGTKPAPITETRTSYDGCKAKDWAVGEWSEVEHCRDNKVDTKRTVTCRIDGAPAADGSCIGIPKPDTYGQMACTSYNSCMLNPQSFSRMTSPQKFVIGKARTGGSGSRYTSSLSVMYDLCNRYGPDKLKRCSGEAVWISSGVYDITVYGIPASAPNPTIVGSSENREYVLSCAP